MTTTLRIVTGSYEHNLLCVALTLGPKGEVFTPIFHFTPHTQSIRDIAWSKKVLVSGANDELIRLYDLQTRRELGTLMHHSGQILVLKFFGQKWLLSGGGDGKIVLWRAKDWELLSELKGHKAPVLDISIHESGRIALSVGEDRRLILWNLMTGRKASVKKLKAAPRQVAFTPGKGADYIVAYDRRLELYDTSGEVKRSWDSKSNFHHIDFYKDALVASTDNGAISFYSLDSDEPTFVLQGHGTRVKDFSILDKWMASVSTDGMIVVWDLEERNQIAAYSAGDRLNCVALIPDNVEKPLKRKIEASVESVETDFSEADEPIAVSQPKKKKKRSRIVITEG